MARVDNSNRKSYVENFDKAGFPIQSWDIKNTRKFIAPDGFNPYRIPKELEKTGKVNFGDWQEPIVFQDTKTGNTYAFYSGSDTNSLPRSWSLQPDEEDGKEFFNTLIDKSILLSKGKRYIQEGGEHILEEGEISEFATLDNFDDIDAPNYATMFATDPTMSEELPKVEVDKLTTDQGKRATELLKQSKAELKELKSAKEEGTLKTQLWTFQEIDDLYNAEITPNQKRAFVIYLQNVLQRQIKGGFNELYGSPYPTPPDTILELIKKGEMFFDGSAEIGKRLQPKVMWLSGNLYKKMQYLKNQAQEVIQRFGEDIYENHKAVLEPAYLELWDTRLTLTNVDKKMRMKLIPISDMAREIQITTIIDPSNRAKQKSEFKVYTSFKKDKGVVKLHEEWVEDLDVVRSSYSDNQITKTHISLLNGFLQWLKLGGVGQRAKDNGIAYSIQTQTPQDINDRYIDPISNPYGAKNKAKWEKDKAETKLVADRLFSQFLETGITGTDRIKIEFIWNSTYNSWLKFDHKQIPIGFTFKKYDKIFLNDIREEKREAIAYWLGTGSGVGLAYGVGMGKTFCAVFIMRQALAMGICSKPLLFVPNQVYFQFMDEIGRILGETTEINPIYNATGTLTNKLANKVSENTITIATYEAIPHFVFDKKNTDEQWLKDTSNILQMGGDGANEEMLDAGLEETQEDIFGSFEVDTDATMEKGGKTSKKEMPRIYVNSDNTGYDFICIDEAHNFNNLFTRVISAPKQIQTGTKSKKTGKLNIQRESNPYSSVRETAGGKDASKRANKFFFISQYIQSKNRLGNTLLLSATPFTNSPLQVYTLLTFCNRQMLVDAELGILKDFYDVFAQIEYTQDYKTNLQIVLRNKFIGWKNLIALQRFLFRTFKKKGREEEDKFVKRPNKITLPLKRKMIDNKIIEISMENRVSTTIGMSEHQIDLWRKVQSYADGGLKYEELCTSEMQNTTSLGKYVAPKSKKQSESDDGGEVDVENPDDIIDADDKNEEAVKFHQGIRSLQCLMWGRQICLNPYLFKCSGYKTEPTGKEYVEASPKMLYTMDCIRRVKAYHEKTNTKMSGQVIYMNFGIKAYPLLREYLVEELGFEQKEIGTITGKENKIGNKTQANKNIVADAFMGRKKVKGETATYEQLPDEDRVKILLGSEAIKEGINLQNYASVLYNLFLDFNPTEQVQVEGRIWRQGNAFANVRIVIPLMADCIDVFMFQKLEDKTTRINQVWTESKTHNELDTTSFNPAELKYELISDPEKLAELEILYRKELLDVEISEVYDELSKFKGLESVFTNAIPLTSFEDKGGYYLKTEDGERGDWVDVNKVPQRALRQYVFLRLYRPDLITKPLFKKCGLEKGAIAVNKSNWNYTPRELTELMGQFNKEHKIAYPINYTKDWREYVEPPTSPLEEGDEVEFDTKKGRKSGIIEEVFLPEGDEEMRVDIAKGEMLYEEIGVRTKKVKRIEKEKIKKKPKIVKLEAFNLFNKDSKDKIWDILHYLLQNDYREFEHQFGSNADGKGSYDERRRVNEEKGQWKKEREELMDKGGIPSIFCQNPQDQNLYELLYLVRLSPSFADFFTDSDEVNIFEYAPTPTIKEFKKLSKQYKMQQMDEWKGDYLDTDQDLFARKYSAYAEGDYWYDAFKDIPMLQSRLKRYYWNNRLFEPADIQTLNDMDKAIEKELIPMGLETLSDVEGEIVKIKEKVGDLELQRKNLDEPENKKEIVQEMERRLVEMQGEDFRSGSGYNDRAVEFATPNADYLGNDMLTIMADTENQKATPPSPKEKKKTEPKAQSKVELESRIASIERMMVFLDNKELKKTNKQTIKSLKLLVKYAD